MRVSPRTSAREGRQAAAAGYKPHEAARSATVGGHGLATSSERGRGGGKPAEWLLDCSGLAMAPLLPPAMAPRVPAPLLSVSESGRRRRRPSARSRLSAAAILGSQEPPRERARSVPVQRSHRRSASESEPRLHRRRGDPPPPDPARTPPPLRRRRGGGAPRPEVRWSGRGRVSRGGVV